MRVNISYSVELEDTPKSVSNIVFQSLEDLKIVEFKLENAVKKLKNDPEISKVLNDIDFLRRDIAKIDIALMESVAILASYQKTVSEGFMPDAPFEEDQGEE